MPYALTRSNGEDNPYCPRGAPWNATKDYLEFFGLVDTVRNLGDLPEVLMVADGGLPSGGLSEYVMWHLQVRHAVWFQGIAGFGSRGVSFSLIQQPWV